MNSDNRVGLNNPRLFYCGYVGAYLEGPVVEKVWIRDHSNQGGLSVFARYLLTHEVEKGKSELHCSLR